MNDIYYKIDVTKLESNIISSLQLRDNIADLINKNYTPIYLTAVKDFTNKKISLQNASYLIISSEVYCCTLRKALSTLVSQHIPLIIFLPLIFSADINTYRKKEIQQLNNFIYSEEFKNIFSVIPN